MKANIITQNTKRMTAQLVVKYTTGDCKRTETRHCRAAPGGKWRGYVLDVHKAMLLMSQVISEQLAREIDAANRELNIKASKATPYTADLLFYWTVGEDNLEAYLAHINSQSQIAHSRIERLNQEVNQLRVLVEVHRAAEREKREKMVRAAFAMSA